MNYLRLNFLIVYFTLHNRNNFIYILPMNNIGFGIFCFGEDYYYTGTVEKINKLLDQGFHCYILTENPEFFTIKYSNTFLHTIKYDRSFKSYYDKMILPKHILKNHDFCILLDADTYIKDYEFINVLKDYKFKYGITYVDTLMNHPSKIDTVGKIQMDGTEWNSYKLYVEKLFPSYQSLETIWEYILIINKIGFNQKQFYNYYEKLQVVKEYAGLTLNKDVNAPGEGISILISSKLSNTEIQRDLDLYEKIKDSMVSISRRFTSPEHLPDFMK